MLSAGDRAAIARLLPVGWAAGDRYNDAQAAMVERYCGGRSGEGRRLRRGYFRQEEIGGGRGRGGGWCGARVARRGGVALQALRVGLARPVGGWVGLKAATRRAVAWGGTGRLFGAAVAAGASGEGAALAGCGNVFGRFTGGGPGRL